jgi:hypothetical protein
VRVRSPERRHLGRWAAPRPERGGEAVPVGWTFDTHGVPPMDEIDAGPWAGYSLAELMTIWEHAHRN